MMRRTGFISPILSIFSSFLDPTRHTITSLYLVFDFGTVDVVSIILQHIKLDFKINMIYFVKSNSLLTSIGIYFAEKCVDYFSIISMSPAIWGTHKIPSFHSLCRLYFTSISNKTRS